MTTPTIGRFVHYRLTADQATLMNARREDAVVNRQKMRDERPGFQAHVGNGCYEGDVVPLLIVRVWPNEFGDKPGVNGQAFLDGNDTLWVTSAGEGSEPGQWSWPARV